MKDTRHSTRPIAASWIHPLNSYRLQYIFCVVLQFSSSCIFNLLIVCFIYSLDSLSAHLILQFIYDLSLRSQNPDGAIQTHNFACVPSFTAVAPTLFNFNNFIFEKMGEVLFSRSCPSKEASYRLFNPLDWFCGGAISCRDE